MIPVTVTFYGDVGFDRSYNHVIDFSNETERSNYFTPKILKTVENCAYNKPMNTIQLQCPYSDALAFTYCKFSIGSNSSKQKTVYAWVDDVVIITDQKDENNVYIPIIQITIAIDPWQTFLFDFTVGESFVSREHKDRYVSNGDGTVGWTLPNQIDKNSVGVTKRARTIKNDFRQEMSVIDINGTVSNKKIRWFCIEYVYADPNKDNLNNIVNMLVPCTDDVQIPFVVQYNNEYYGQVSLLTSSMLDGSFLQFCQLDPERVASVTYIPFDIATFTVLVAHTQKQGSFIEQIYGNFARANFLNTNENFKVNVRPIKWFGESMFTQPLPFFAIEPILINNNGFPHPIKLSYTLTNQRWNKPTNNAVYSSNYEPQLYKEPFKKITVVDEFNIEKGEFADIFTNIYDNTTNFNFDIYILFDSVDMRIRIVPNGMDINSTYWIEFSLSHVEVLRSAWLSYLLQERSATRDMIQSQANQQLIASAIGGVSSSVSMGGGQALSPNASAGGVAGGAALGLGIGAIQTVGGFIANQNFAFEQQDIREKAIKNKANNIAIQGVFKSVIGEFKLVETSCDETTFNIKANEYHKYGYPTYLYETPNIKSRKYYNFIVTTITKINGSLNNNIKMALMDIFNNGVTIWHGDYISELSGIGDYSKENIERSLL